MTTIGLCVAMSLQLLACGDGCHDRHRSYEDGDHWTCSDGCNQCSCKDGTVSHGNVACGGSPSPAAGQLACLENGRWHYGDEPWKCKDGCSECRCNDGQLLKSSEACGD